MPRKGGLGKGLESLMGEGAKSYSQQPAATFIPIQLLEPNPDQPRHDFEPIALAELADSIKQNGVLQPILVRKAEQKYQIIAGERRYQASKLAGLKKVPCMIKDISDEDVFKLALIENLQRSDLNPMEEALAYRQLLDEQNLTQEQLAQILSKSRSAVANSVRLLDLPDIIQGFVAEGKLTAGHARAILAVPDDTARVDLAKKVINEHLSVRQTEALIPAFSGKKKAAPAKPAAPQSYKAIAKDLGQVLGCDVAIKQVRGKNKIEIDFKDEADLLRIFRDFFAQG